MSFYKQSAKILLLGTFSSLLCISPVTHAGDDDSFAPGGTATDYSTEQFKDLKIVMDLKAHYASDVAFGMSVAKRIMAHPNAQLVVIIEGPSVAMFAKKNYLDHQGIVDGWAELANKGVHVEFCGNSVHGAGLTPQDMDGLSNGTPAVVNTGAYPTLAHFEKMGFAMVIPSPQEKPPAP